MRRFRDWKLLLGRPRTPEEIAGGHFGGSLVARTFAAIVLLLIVGTLVKIVFF